MTALNGQARPGLHVAGRVQKSVMSAEHFGLEKPDVCRQSGNGRHERVMPTCGDLRVVVQQHDVPTTRGLDPAVDCESESGVLRETNDVHVWELIGQRVTGPVLTPVIHHDHVTQHRRGK
jgi:hypothetical protein